jgi:uncharacterized protein YegP (UPF0339 family)
MRFLKYQDTRHEWRWALVAANNRTLADSGEGYKNELDLMHAINLIRGAVEIPVVHKREDDSRRSIADALLRGGGTVLSGMVRGQ